MSRPPSPPSLLGIDSGLTVTKAVVFDLDGRALGVGSAPARNRVLRSRWVEKDPTQQWHDTAGAVRTAIAAAGVDPASIEAVGLTGHGDGVYLIGEDGLPVRPALPSLDTRAHEVVARWRRNGVADRALALAGELPFPQHAPAMLVWLREHEPGVLERTRWVLSAKDWLKLQLTGTVTTDPTDASAGFTDVRGQGYAPALRALYGLEEVEGKLPPIVPPTEPVGQVRPEAAAETGIPAGTPVPSGLHDIAAASVGSGATEPGEMLMVAGTYSVNQVLGDRPVVDGRWLCRSWLRPGRWAHMSTSPTSATNTEWAAAGHRLQPPHAHRPDPRAAAVDQPAAGGRRHPLAALEPALRGRAGTAGVGRGRAGGWRARRGPVRGCRGRPLRLHRGCRGAGGAGRTAPPARPGPDQRAGGRVRGVPRHRPLPAAALAPPAVSPAVEPERGADGRRGFRSGSSW